MESSPREHRREQLREAQRRSRQRRQMAMERLSEENRDLTAELNRIKSSISELVDFAWEKWAVGEVSNEILGRIIALTQAGDSANNPAQPSTGQPSYGETGQWPRLDPNLTSSDSQLSITPVSRTESQGGSSVAEASTAPFAETPLPLDFQDEHRS